MNIIDGITFDDVLLVPNHSNIPSRSEIDVSTDLGKGVKLDVPLISANMKTVTGVEMAKAIGNTPNGSRGLALLHRFDSLEQQVENFKKATEPNVTFSNQINVGISVGISSEEDNDFLISETGTKIVCIDVAHGDHDRVIKETTRISTKYPDVLLIVGNVATGAGALRLATAGANVIKVGVGPGSLCTTRVETGNGVPQLTALNDVYTSLQRYSSLGFDKRPKIIADGGIKAAGDVVKALCFSDAVMLGSVFAGTEEAPGEIVKIDGMQYKKYAGSSTHKTNRVEGVSGLTPYKGPVNRIVEVFKEGLQSGLSYQGCRNLEELKDSPRFVRISSAGLKESHPHANLKM